MFKSRRLIAAAIASLPIAAPACAEEPQGDWQGVLQLPGGQLRVVVHIKKETGSRFSGSFDSPDQRASGIPLGSVTADDRTLAFEVPTIRARYRGTWDATQRQWKGQWNQGAALPLDLSRIDRAAVSARPVVAGLDGDWDGAIDGGAFRLRLVFHVKTTDSGTTATMDSVDQSATGIPVASVSRSGDIVKFDMPAIGGAFEGTLAPDGRRLAGRWTQAGQTSALTLARRAAGHTGPGLKRLQTPAKPYPYREEDVAYDSTARVRLAGTLTLPAGTGAFPAVVLIAGSGPNDRNEAVFGHQLFLVLADHLTRQGIAVLRFDKRGVGQSTGDYPNATSAEFADDVDAGIAYLKTRPEIDAGRLGLIGHSEGGLIAPMVAARDSSVAFIVLMAGPGIRGDEIVLAQGRLIAKAMGASEAAIEQEAAIGRKVFAAVESARDAADAAAKAREILAASKRAGTSDTAVEARAKAVSSNWFRFFLAYDPKPALRQVKCPLLAVTGSKDLQVPAKENLDAIREALAGNPDVEVVELPGLNHLFQTASTGAPREYVEIEETMAPSALDLISRWILQRR